MTERGRPLSKNPKNQAEQVRQGSQVNHNAEDRTLHTCKIVLSGHVRRMHRNLLDMSEHEQCCGCRYLSYSMVGADICHTRRSRWNQPHATSHQQYCGRRQTTLYPTAWATRLGSTQTLFLSHSLSCKVVPFIYKGGCALSKKSTIDSHRRFQRATDGSLRFSLLGSKTLKPNKAYVRTLSARRSSRHSWPFGPESDRTSDTPHLTPSRL